MKLATESPYFRSFCLPSQKVTVANNASDQVGRCSQAHKAPEFRPLGAGCDSPEIDFD